MSRRSPAAGRIASAAAAAALLLGGCSDGREYAVPSELCGVPVDPALLAPFLPEGETVEQSTHASAPGRPRCEITVDKKRVLTLHGDVIEPDEDPMKVQARMLVGSERIDVGDDGRVADATVIAVADCTYQGEPHRFVAQAYPPIETADVARRRGDMTRFMAAYFPAAMKAVGCTS